MLNGNIVDASHLFLKKVKLHLEFFIATCTRICWMKEEKKMKCDDEDENGDFLRGWGCAFMDRNMIA